MQMRAAQQSLSRARGASGANPFSGPGGIWTPGAAMGDRLIKRLVDNAGLTFEVEA